MSELTNPNYPHVRCEGSDKPAKDIDWLTRTGICSECGKIIAVDAGGLAFGHDLIQIDC